MRKIFYFLMIALFLASCEEAQKPGAKTMEEISKCSMSCVEHFIEEVYKGNDNARSRCFEYTLPDGVKATLFDVASTSNDKWNPDEVSVSENIETVCDNGVLKYAIVKAKYHDKEAKFFVAFDKGFDKTQFSGDNELAGSEGKTVILDSEGFVSSKRTENAAKIGVQITFAENSDLIDYFLSKFAVDNVSKSKGFLKSLLSTAPNYKDYPNGKSFGSHILKDSIKIAELREVKYDVNLQMVLARMTNGEIQLSGIPCEIVYTRDISLSLENGKITKSIGLFDCVSYCQTKYGNTEFVPGAFFYTNRETTDEELLQDIKKAYDAKKELEEMRRLSKEINSMM